MGQHSLSAMFHGLGLVRAIDDQYYGTAIFCSLEHGSAKNEYSENTDKMIGKWHNFLPSEVAQSRKIYQSGNRTAA